MARVSVIYPSPLRPKTISSEQHSNYVYDDIEDEPIQFIRDEKISAAIRERTRKKDFAKIILYVLNCSAWMNITWIRKWKYVSFITIVGLMADIICYSIGYSISTFVLNFRYPIPVNGYLYWYIILTS